MKNFVLLALLCLVSVNLVSVNLVSHESSTPTVKTADPTSLPIKINTERSMIQTNNPFPAPEIEFIPNTLGQDVIPIMDSYYDYTLFGYLGHNIQQQPDISEPNGYMAGGTFISFMASETDSTSREVYYAYLDQNSIVQHSGKMNPFNTIREGFPSLAIDNLTGDALAAWHIQVSETDLTKVMLGTNPFHTDGEADSWMIPHIIIDNPEIEYNEYQEYLDDEFIWPQLRVGSSPVRDHRRAYIYAKNKSQYDNSESYNPIFGYTDFNNEQLESGFILDWHFQEFSYFNDDNQERENLDLVVNSDGKVAFIGSKREELFVLLSEDFGETFEVHTQYAVQEINDPYGNYPNLLLHPSSDGSHFNGTFTDNNSKLVWMGAVNLNTPDGFENNSYLPAYIYPKIFSFDLTNNSFHFYDIEIQDNAPADGDFALPWGTNDEGELEIQQSYPSWYYDGDFQDSYFHHGRFQISSNNNWVLSAWHDNRKHVQAYNEIENYSDWLQQPEIAYCVSIDGGITWSDITYMNANPADNQVNESLHLDDNYYSELGDITITNISLGSKLNVLENSAGNYHAEVSIGFYKDNSYGSYNYGDGEDLGGTISYAKLDVEFPAGWNGEMTGAEEEEIGAVNCKLGNYPNPFNPTTEIRFQISDLSAQNSVEIEIFNVKGQKVKSYHAAFPEYIKSQNDTPYHSITWNGTDKNNNPVSSGVYFYTLKQNNQVLASSKMLLIK